MIKISKLKKPGKKSGYELPAGETTEARGLVITNGNTFSVYVDKFTKKKGKVKARAKK